MIQNTTNPRWPTSSWSRSCFSLLTFYAELHADLSYRTTVRNQSVLPDLQFRNCDSMINISTIYKSTKDVRRLFYACYSKLFRLNFQTDPSIWPSMTIGIVFRSNYPVYTFILFRKENSKKNAFGFLFLPNWRSIGLLYNPIPIPSHVQSTMSWTDDL